MSTVMTKLIQKVGDEVFKLSKDRASRGEKFYLYIVVDDTKVRITDKSSRFSGTWVRMNYDQVDEIFGNYVWLDMNVSEFLMRIVDYVIHLYVQAGLYQVGAVLAERNRNRILFNYRKV